MSAPRTTIHRSVVPVILAAGLLWQAAASAAPPEPAVVKRAADRFDQAMASWQRGDKHLALQGFRDAHDLVPTDSTLWNVIVVEQELGLAADAHRHLDTYLREFETHIPPARLKEAVDLRRELQDKLARMRVVADALGVTVWIDGARSEADTWLAPGRHLVRVEAPGRRPAEKTVTLERGKPHTVELRLPASSPPDPVKRNLGLAFVGLGAAGIVAGGALTIKAVTTKGASSSTAAFTPNYEGVDFSRTAQVSFTMGALALAIGTHLVLTSPPAPRVSTKPAPGTLLFRAAPAPGGAFGVLSGTF